MSQWRNVPGSDRSQGAICPRTKCLSLRNIPGGEGSQRAKCYRGLNVPGTKCLCSEISKGGQMFWDKVFF